MNTHIYIIRYIEINTKDIRETIETIIIFYSFSDISFALRKKIG